MDRLQLRAALPVAVLLAVLAGGSLVVGQRLDGGVRLNGVEQGAYTIGNSGLATTSTDGFSILNTTPSTSGVPVQMSPRLKWCGTAYNSTSTLSETDCFFAEDLPATAAGATSATLKIGYIAPGGAVTYPFQLTSAGLMTVGTAGGASTQVGSNGGTGNLSLLNASGVGTDLRAINAGTVNVSNNNGTGSQLKVDALPTAGTCGTSPAVTAGSTPLAGSINVGTGGTATSCTVTFNGTAFPSAPFCLATPTTTNAVTRASASTTVLTLSSTTAWTASDVIQWHCISSK